MSLHLLIYGEEDERALLDYVVRAPVFICGPEVSEQGEPTYRLSKDDVIELGYGEPLTFGFLHPELGQPTPIKQPTTALSWKTEVVAHRDFIHANKDQGMMDFYLSPLLIYKRPYVLDEFMTESIVVPAGAEAYESVNDWYKRIYSWCRNRGTNVFSWKHSLFPGQFISNNVNTRWAFPAALKHLEAGGKFCAREARRQIEIARRRQTAKAN